MSEPAPVRCVGVEARSAICLLCGGDKVSRYWDHDLNGRVCAPCGPLLIASQQLLLEHCKAVPPPDGVEPRPITIIA